MVPGPRASLQARDLGRLRHQLQRWLRRKSSDLQPSSASTVLVLAGFCIGWHLAVGQAGESCSPEPGDVRGPVADPRLLQQPGRSSRGHDGAGHRGVTLPKARRRRVPSSDGRFGKAGPFVYLPEEGRLSLSSWGATAILALRAREDGKSATALTGPTACPRLFA